MPRSYRFISSNPGADIQVPRVFPVAPPAPSGDGMLRAADITYLGAFRLFGDGGQTAGYSLLTKRYVNGGAQLNFFTTTGLNKVDQAVVIAGGTLSTTAARIQVQTSSSGQVFPAVGRYMQVNDNYSIHLSSVTLVSAGVYDIVWDVALPFIPSIGAIVSPEPQQLNEVKYPGTASLHIPTSYTDGINCPQATLVRFWGDLYQGKQVNDSGVRDSYQNTNSLLWSAARNGLYWAYVLNYAADRLIPCLGLTLLDDTAHTLTAYGPWWLTCDQGGVTTPKQSNLAHGMAWVDDTSWAASHLGSSTAIMMSGGVQSATGPSIPFGQTFYALSGASIPTESTPLNASGTAIVTKCMAAADIIHRQRRPLFSGVPGYQWDFGSVKWNCKVDTTNFAPTTTSADFHENAGTGIRVGMEGFQGAPGYPVTIYFVEQAQTVTVVSVGALDGSGNQRVVWTPALPLAPVADEHVLDLNALYGEYGHFPSIKYTIAESPEWMSDGTVGFGTPTTPYFLLNDVVTSARWLKTPNFNCVLTVGSLGMGHGWYGNGMQCGHGKESPTGGAQGPTQESYRCMMAVWDPASFVNVLNGAAPYSQLPNSWIDLQTDLNMVVANMFDRYPISGTVPRVTAVDYGPDPDDPTKTLLFMMATNVTPQGTVSYSLVHVYRINNP